MRGLAPYFNLRSYLAEGDPRKPFEIGLEATIEEYVARIVEVFREVRRVLRPDATLWLNLGDAYANDGKWGGRTSGKHAQGPHGAASGVRRLWADRVVDAGYLALAGGRVGGRGSADSRGQGETVMMTETV